MKVKLRRNKHNLSHYKLGTCFPGELIPVGLVEVIPGDTFNHSIGTFLRMLPMNAPLIHRAQVRVHSFFVPFRILWDGFEDFITRQSGADPMPSIDLNNIISGASTIRLAEYLGVSMDGTTGSGITISTLPFAAYNMIYNEWYRDQDLVAPLVQDAATIINNDISVRRVAWQKDYFTSARPTPQKGADVTLPLGVSAPVLLDNHTLNQRIKTAAGGGTFTDRGPMLAEAGTPPNMAVSASSFTGDLFLDPNGTLIADLSNATAVDVNAVRTAFRLQALAERLQQFGSRYPEYLASMGVKSSDARLQRPEYLGGGKVPINFSEVLQTADSATAQVGEMRGHAIAPGHVRPYRRFFEEHGYVMTLLSIRPQSVYSTVLPRMFSHGLVDGANDFYTPELERIGQQEIYNREIYQAQATQGDVWGYNDRYAEYRHQPSQVSGDLKVGDQLDYWTWARGFSSLPALNQTFTDCNPSSRVFFDEVDAPVIFGCNHKLIAQRMLTKNTIGRIM